jgi:1-acyl-sn-glycerol-3-phosphate acyltransferase
VNPPIPVGASIPRRRSAPLMLLGRFMLGLAGWRFEGEVPDIPKIVIAVAPHTSNWDFVVGMLAMFALDLDLSFLAKHTLFRNRVSASFFRWLGGIPVDRTAAHGVVGDAVQAFERADRKLLVVAPEGTRKHVEHFKPGFLHIARGAHVPVLFATLDYGRKVVRLGPWFEPGEDVEVERKRCEEFYADVRGFKPR